MQTYKTLEESSDEEVDPDCGSTIFRDALPRMEQRASTDDYRGVLWIEKRIGMIDETAYLIENIVPLLAAYKHKPLYYLTHTSRHGILAVFSTYSQAMDAHTDVICEGKCWLNGKNKFGVLSSFSASKIDEIRMGLHPQRHLFVTK
jgi:hypothetical protein